MEAILIIGMALIVTYQAYSYGREDGYLTGYKAGVLQAIDRLEKYIGEEKENDVSDLQENG